MGRIIDWFRKWFANEVRYDAALKDRRRLLDLNESILLETRESAERIVKLSAALDDERQRFEKELSEREKELQDSTEINRRQKVENDLKELAYDGSMKINAALHSQVEMIEGRHTAEKVQNLTDPNKNPLQGIL